MLGTRGAVLTAGLNRKPSDLEKKGLLYIKGFRSSMERHVCEKLNGQHLIHVPLRSLLSGRGELLSVTAECVGSMSDLRFTDHANPSSQSQTIAREGQLPSLHSTLVQFSPP